MSDVPGTLGKVAEHYAESLQQHGAAPKGVGWGTDADHRLRFEKLTEVLRPVSGSFTVNDLGCGYAALFDYMVTEGLPFSGYRGHDISANMLVAARARVRDARATFSEAGQLDERADYSFASGIFNVRFKEDDAAWRDYILTTLGNMNHFSERGFAFNLLSSYVDWKEEHLFYAEPCFFFDHCKRHFSRRVSLLHDTPLYEWTIVVRK